MNGWIDTSIAVANLTDEGLFESLATDVLRHTAPAYAPLAHVGTNAAGKTRKAPVDALAFELAASPAHLVVVHHTLSAVGGLAKKWLRDPSKIKKRKANSPDAVPGDVIKSIQVIEKERLRRPTLRATLVLTTNNEPDDSLLLDVHALCELHQIDVDIWARARIVSVLDTTAAGQWIRRKYLGIPQQRLSAERLAELSAVSLELARPIDEPVAWAQRHLDQELAAISRPATFLVSRSGSGKSVACYRLACDYVARDGYALVLSADTVNEATTIENAIDAALRRLDPALTGTESPLQWSTPTKPLLLIVEDINRSGQPVRLIEKITRWAVTAERAKGRPSWRLICPTWPHLVAAVDHSIFKEVAGMTQPAGGMTAAEGTSAVTLRAKRQGRQLSFAQAAAVSRDLGHDPLLIALYDFDERPSSQAVIGQYVHRELRSLEQSSLHLAIEYLTALRAVSLKLLSQLKLEPTVSQVLEYCMSDYQAQLIRALVLQGSIIYQQAGPDIDPVLRFRHDRVRDWLFIDALADQDARDPLSADAIGDPFLADVVGEVIAVRGAPERMLSLARTVAPLSLFHALRSLSKGSEEVRARVLVEIGSWLDEIASDEYRCSSLLWECLAALARTDDPAVPALVRRIPYQHPPGLSAALRNGDVIAGAELCARYEPGYGAGFRDAQIGHALHVFGESFVASVRAALRTTLDARHKSGLLRLAGHIGSPALGEAIHEFWKSDAGREDHLADYLWALARCCEPATAKLYLQPVTDMWALLSDHDDNQGVSPRGGLALYNVDWAFANAPPVHALPYLIERAGFDDLRGPILYMLRGVTNDLVLDLVLNELAARHADSPESAYFFRTGIFGIGERERRLPEPYRSRLAGIWGDVTSQYATRRAAFDLWSMGIESRDLHVLLEAQVEPDWGERILQKRLVCGDPSAVHALIANLEEFSEKKTWWWQFAEFVPCNDVLGCIERTLEWRRANAGSASKQELDWHVAPILMNYPVESIESLLIKHWDHLFDSPKFIHVALFAATSRTKKLAATAIEALAEPREAFKYVAMSFGIKRSRGVTVTRPEQIEALAPYVNLIPEHDLAWLAEQCNSQGWIDTRRSVLDSALAAVPSRWSSERAHEILDELANRKNRWVQHEVDRVLEAGVSWPDFLADLEGWLESRRTISALAFVAEAIEHKGSRADLAVLRRFQGKDKGETRNIISNTTFSVRRRVA